jgi:hypothetical protein
VGQKRRAINFAPASHPILLENIRNCQIKATPHVEKKDLLQTAGLTLRSGSSSLSEMGSGLYRRGQAMGEGESLWSPIICDHQKIEQVDYTG